MIVNCYNYLVFNCSLTCLSKGGKHQSNISPNLLGKVYQYRAKGIPVMFWKLNEYSCKYPKVGDIVVFVLPNARNDECIIDFSTYMMETVIIFQRNHNVNKKP